MSICLAPARAAASRRNGAKSCGPKTPEGKARAAQNALKHGLCAQKHVVLRDEDARAFAALEAAIIEELGPQGVLQRLLAGRIARAGWRLERAERIEAELIAYRRRHDGDLAMALIRDGNCTRSFDTLLRYRGSALGEFYRALRMLQALQAEAAQAATPDQDAAAHASRAQPNEPEGRTNPDKTLSQPSADESGASDSRGTGAEDAPSRAQRETALSQGARVPTSSELPIGPDTRRDPGESAEKKSLSDGAASPPVPSSLRPAVGTRIPRAA